MTDTDDLQVMTFRELAVLFVEAVANENQAEAERLGLLMDDRYPEETAVLHLFVDTENALHGDTGDPT